MEKIFMTSGILTSAIVILMGLFKLTIKRYKEKSWYKPLLTSITLVLTIGLCVLCEKFILEMPFMCWEFIQLLTATFAGVFLGYNGVYEGMNLKDGIHSLFAKWKELKALSPEAKAVKAVEKVESKLLDLYNTNQDAFKSVINGIVLKAKAQESVVAEVVVVETPQTQKSGTAIENIEIR